MLFYGTPTLEFSNELPCDARLTANVKAAHYDLEDPLGDVNVSISTPSALVNDAYNGTASGASYSSRPPTP